MQPSAGAIERSHPLIWGKTMKVHSVNVSGLREIKVGGRAVLTGIYKEPSTQRVRVNRLSLEGDRQADLRVHGGEFKAVYAYPLEHYAYWEEGLNSEKMPPGMFGENLTTTGMLEDQVCIGDIYRIGSAELQVTQPRTPCFKLAHKFQRPAIIKEFLQSGRSGFYLRVIQEGEVEAGDMAELIYADPRKVTVRALLGLTDLNEYHFEVARRVLEIDALPPNWREEVAALVKN
jgi:MOSC domain-containing protein YiiM